MTTKILFAGGGTAGHVEPALAVANWLRNEKPNWEYVFVGTKKGLENQLVPAAGFDLLHISKVVLPRQFTPETFVLPIKILTATWQAIKICKEVDLVIGLLRGCRSQCTLKLLPLKTVQCFFEGKFRGL